MFTLKYSDIRNPQFSKAFSKLTHFGGYRDQKVAYNIARMAKLIDQEQRAMKEEFLKLLKKFAVLDDSGNVKVNEMGAFEVPDEKKADWDEAAKKFETQVVKIKRHRIKLEDTEGAGLAPIDLLALEPVMANLEAV